MGVRSSARWILALLFGWAALLLTVASFGQVTTTNIVGTVTDSSGAAIPSAQVTATNTGTGYTRNTQTGAQGEYHLEFLPVGNYTVDISANGFK
ncbi:MAG TPA: carboxypeptidase-like regulatory domain-containing protein, partial [Terriglobales bacterium]|nr:carboxypeptidase-like regulatory domain-containing protein [Terriglobales bacterium]